MGRTSITDIGSTVLYKLKDRNPTEDERYRAADLVQAQSTALKKCKDKLRTMCDEIADDFYKANPDRNLIIFRNSEQQQMIDVVDHLETVYKVHPKRIVYDLLRDNKSEQDMMIVKALLDKDPTIADHDLLVSSMAVLMKRPGSFDDNYREAFSRRFEMVRDIYNAVKKHEDATENNLRQRVLQEEMNVDQAKQDLEYEKQQIPPSAAFIQQAEEEYAAAVEQKTECSKRLLEFQRYKGQVRDCASWIDKYQTNPEKKLKLTKEEIDEISLHAAKTISSTFDIVINNMDRSFFKISAGSMVGTGLALGAGLFTPLGPLVAIGFAISLTSAALGLVSKGVKIFEQDIVPVLNSIGGFFGDKVSGLGTSIANKIRGGESAEKIQEEAKKELLKADTERALKAEKNKQLIKTGKWRDVKIGPLLQSLFGDNPPPKGMPVTYLFEAAAQEVGEEIKFDKKYDAVKAKHFEEIVKHGKFDDLSQVREMTMKEVMDRVDAFIVLKAPAHSTPSTAKDGRNQGGNNRRFDAGGGPGGGLGPI